MEKDSESQVTPPAVHVKAKDAAVAAKDAAVAAKDYVLEAAAAVKDYLADSAGAATDVIVEKATHGKDLAIEKALAGKDFVAERVSAMKDVVAEKTGVAQGEARQNTGKALGSNDILANTAFQARSQSGVEANRQKGGVGPSAYESMVESAEKAKAEAFRSVQAASPISAVTQSSLVRETQITSAPQMSGEPMTDQQMQAVSSQQPPPQMAGHRGKEEGGAVPNVLAGATAQQAAKDSRQHGTKSATPVIVDNTVAKRSD